MFRPRCIIFFLLMIHRSTFVGLVFFHCVLSGNNRYVLRTSSSSSKSCRSNISRSVVLCISVCSFHALSGRSIVLSLEYTVKIGVFIFFEALINSSNLGMPSVTFLALLPAWWNVLSVICIVGSPTDCAAMVPTISPGATIDLNHFLSNMSVTCCKTSGLHV